MTDRNIVWLPNVREKLKEFRSVRFTPEETFEDLLKNNVVGTLKLPKRALKHNLVLQRTMEVFRWHCHKKKNH